MIWWKWRSGFQVHVATLPWPTQGSSSLCPGVTFWAARVANSFLINNWSLNKKTFLSYLGLQLLTKWLPGDCPKVTSIVLFNLRWLVGFCSWCLPSFHTARGFQLARYESTTGDCSSATRLHCCGDHAGHEAWGNFCAISSYLSHTSSKPRLPNEFLKFHAQLVWKFWQCFGS